MLDSSSILLGIAMLVIAILAFILLVLRAPIMSALENYATGFSKKIHTSKMYRTSMYTIIGLALIIYIIGVYILAVSSKSFLSSPPFVWIFFTLFNWIIFPLSVIMVFTIIWDFIRRRSFSSDSHPFLLLFYVSFSLLLLLAIFLDRVIGTGIGNNLELRVFPYFMFFAVALASMTILKWRHQLYAKRWQSTGKILFIILIIILSMNSLLKSTNDPIVTNNWLFFSAGEKIGMDWIESNLKGVAIWAGLDNRIAAAFNYNSNFDSSKKIGFSSSEKAKHYFVSDTIKERARRVDHSLPPVKDLNRIYESDKVKLYYRSVKNPLH